MNDSEEGDPRQSNMSRGAPSVGWCGVEQTVDVDGGARPPRRRGHRHRWGARAVRRRGLRTVLVTCTDGRCGDGPGGVKPGDPGTIRRRSRPRGRRELEASCAILGVSDLEVLGYADSGMAGWSTNDAPGRSGRRPCRRGRGAAGGADRQVRAGRRRDLRPQRLLRAPRPHPGAPDHEAALDGPRPRRRSTGRRCRTRPWRSSAEMAREAGMEVRRGRPCRADMPSDRPARRRDLRPGSTWTAYADRKFAALGAHASQEETMPS